MDQCIVVAAKHGPLIVGTWFFAVLVLTFVKLIADKINRNTKIINTTVDNYKKGLLVIFALIFTMLCCFLIGWVVGGVANWLFGVNEQTVAWFVALLFLPHFLSKAIQLSEVSAVRP